MQSHLYHFLYDFNMQMLQIALMSFGIRLSLKTRTCRNANPIARVAWDNQNLLTAKKVTIASAVLPTSVRSKTCLQQ
jgi:hypothetical protein